jgi:hypothetical protein
VLVAAGVGDGTFQSPVSHSLGSWQALGVLRVADMTGDGRLDVIAASKDPTLGGYALQVLPADGSGGFGAVVTTPIADQPWSFTVAELTGDGLPDVAVAAGSAVYVLAGMGGGTLDPSPRFALSISATSVASGDFDHDGAPDLAVGSRFENDVTVLLKRGSMLFAGVPVALGSYPIDILALDLNGDGTLDLIAPIEVSIDSSAQLKVFLGNRAGTFEPPISLPIHLAAASIAAGDLDGDGLPELALARSGEIELLLNGHPLTCH